MSIECFELHVHLFSVDHISHFGRFCLDYRTRSRLEISSDTNQAEVDPGLFRKQVTEIVSRREGPATSVKAERGHRKRAVSEESIPSTKRGCGSNRSYLSAQVLAFRLNRYFGLFFARFFYLMN